MARVNTWDYLDKGWFATDTALSNAYPTGQN